VFTSTFWKELFQFAGVKLLLSSAFQLQIDGQSEVTNLMIAMYLRCLAGDRPRSWLQWLPWAEFCYNSSYQSSLRTTPFQVVYGWQPPTLLKYESGSSRVAAVEQLKDHGEFLKQIRECLLLAQYVMKVHSNSRRQVLEFNVGDWVWLCLHHRSATGITPLWQSKLSPRFYGPYKVIEPIGDVAYRLQLPAKARIHDVFHVALLKWYVGQPPTDVIPLPSIHHGRVIPTPEKVIQARLNRGHWEILVAWQGQASTDSTWKKVTDFKIAYPSFQLKDELFLEEGEMLWTLLLEKFTKEEAQGKNPQHSSLNEL
jgi:hypothetical protein